MDAKGIEKSFKETLKTIADLGMTATEIKSDAKLYNEIAEDAFKYFGIVALRTGYNRTVIWSTGFEFDEFLDEVVMHFLVNLDAVIACNEEGRMPFITTLTKNKVISMVREWHRMNGTTKKKPTIESGKEDKLKNESQAIVTFLDETALSNVPDKRNMEQEVENKERLELIFTTLAKEAKPFNAVLFLAMRVLDWTYAKFVEKLRDQGYKKTMDEIIKEVLKLEYVDKKVFAKIIDDSRINSSELNKKVQKKGLYNRVNRTQKELERRKDYL